MMVRERELPCSVRCRRGAGGRGGVTVEYCGGLDMAPREAGVGANSKQR